MTEKEKAHQLVEVSKNYVHGFIGSSMLSNTEFAELVLERAKILVTTVVDEILTELQYNQKQDWWLYRKDGKEFTTYWNEVKNEIQNL